MISKKVRAVLGIEEELEKVAYKRLNDYAVIGFSP